MKRTNRILCLLIGVFGLTFGASVSAELATIKLYDGSSIRGEIVSLKGGNYRVQSPTLGTIDVKQSDVRVVEYTGAQSAASASVASGQPLSQAPQAPEQQANAQLNQQFQSMQQSILSNPAIMQLVQSLQNDASVQAIVSDPEIQAAIQRGDYGALMSNPKIHQLMNNSKVQAITKQVR